MSDEWGPWIDHDGNGCPCLGMWVDSVHEGTRGRVYRVDGVAGRMGGLSWDWDNYAKLTRDGRYITRVVRYRIRKPRALLDLIEMVESLPEKMDA